MKRIAITGSTGYLGSRLVEHFKSKQAEVLGIDIAVPKRDRAAEPDQFEKCDIRDPEIVEILAKFQPDIIVHSAFIVAPLRNRRKMRQTNVEGTRNLLQAASAIQVPKLCVVSSATAYGAWPDNPIPMSEAMPIRPRKEFQYSADKGEVESMLKEFARQEPGILTSWVRPAIIGGPNLDNYLRRFIFGVPFLVMCDGVNTPLQFVHEQDVVAAISTIIEGDGTGPYNIAPDDWSTIKEIARLSNRRAVVWPFWFTRFLHGCAWSLRLPFHESPPSFLYFARYPWVVRSQKLQEELGFRFQFSNRDTLTEIVKNQK